MPAGIEINVRTTGRSLPIKVEAWPNRLKNLSERSKSCCDIKKYLPYRSTKGLPPYLPIQYVIADPAALPTPLAKAIPTKVNLPSLTKYPAKGIIISLGNG